MGYKALDRLEKLRQLNSDRNWVNDDLYRLMYREDLYVVAYERIKSEPGNMTPGTDGETLDGWSERVHREIISKIRDSSFQFKPARTKYIPKANGKMRRLGIPSTRDKVVQEVMRMILEAIYDSPHGAYLSNASHGFRPNRGCHTALKEYRTSWSAVNWIIEGDIKACFDDIDHGILVSILRKKIKDERFIDLIWKLLRAGYMDMDGQRKDSLAGTPQGGIVSPILANIYLNELDDFVEQLRKKYQKGEKKAPNPLYRHIEYRKSSLKVRGRQKTKEFRELIKQLRTLPTTVVNDPGFVRIRYLRYADDWIIGLMGPSALAEQIKQEIGEFLSSELKLTLSQEKTKITSAKKEEALFLGTHLRIGVGGEAKVVLSRNGHGTIKRRSTGWETRMIIPMKRLIDRLNKKGICTPDGKPVAKRGWAFLDAEQIVALYSGINRGYQNYYRFADNFGMMTRIQYILQMSLAKTLALKLRLRYSRIFKKYGPDLCIRVKSKDGKKDREIRFYLNHNWAKKRLQFATSDERVDLVQESIRLRTRSKLGQPCCICGATERVEMHHVRAIRKMDSQKPTQGFTRVMRALNRKQIPVCDRCHDRIHAGLYDGLNLSDLAYDPR